MRLQVVTGAAFPHVVFVQDGRTSRVVHVYVDGDGIPWRAGQPATDPTPRNPLLLRLMAIDPEPSVYLGRPCYHGLSDLPPCSTALWTRERYSEAVVSSMEAALRQVLHVREVERLAWFGYSGGGSLAMLLAPRFRETTDVVTIAANLDIDAWTDLHGYSRLVGSLNPARQPPLPARIRQRHYVGGADDVVPARVVARAWIPPETVVLIPSYSHTCCWETIWPKVLAGIDEPGSSVR